MFMTDKIDTNKFPEVEKPMDVKDFGKLKECLSIAIAAKSPKISLIKNSDKVYGSGYESSSAGDYCDAEGDLEFCVFSRHLGLTAPMLKKYENEIVSVVFANIVGELLVRENISKFVDIITSLNPQDYGYKVNNCVHENFGIIIDGRKLVFKFHSSLIQKIITENFKGIINEKAG